jgi:hypothetical protein
MVIVVGLDDRIGLTQEPVDTKPDWLHLPYIRLDRPPPGRPAGPGLGSRGAASQPDRTQPAQDE